MAISKLTPHLIGAAVASLLWAFVAWYQANSAYDMGREVAAYELTAAFTCPFSPSEIAHFSDDIQRKLCGVPEMNSGWVGNPAQRRLWLRFNGIPGDEPRVFPYD